MRMPSDEDFQRLQETVQALAIQVNAANNKIRDLEAGMQDHIGLDWGGSLVDVNSPHRFLSVDTLEAGGGAVRVNLEGMKFVTPTDSGTVNADERRITWYTDEEFQTVLGRLFQSFNSSLDASYGLFWVKKATDSEVDIGVYDVSLDDWDSVMTIRNMDGGVTPYLWSVWGQTASGLAALLALQMDPDEDNWTLYIRQGGTLVEFTGGGGVSIVNSDNWAEGVGEEFWYDVTGSTMGGWTNVGTTVVQSGGTGDWLSSSDMDEAYIEIDAAGGHEYHISPLRFGGAMWNRMIELLRGSAPTKLCVEFTAAFPNAASSYSDYEGVGFWSDNSAPASTAAVAVITKNGLGNWQLYSGVGATATDTGSAADTNPHRFRIEVGTSTIEWFVDGTSQGTITRPNDCWPVGFGMSTGNGVSGDIRLHGHGRVYAA